MMTHEKLTSILDTLSIPWADLVFDKKQKPPYAIIRMSDTSNIFDDFGEVSIVQEPPVMELYYRKASDRKRFETALKEAKAIWQRYGSDTYLDSESLFFSRYDFE